jgi:hypothetical protein
MRGTIEEITGSTVQVKVPELEGTIKVITNNASGLALHQAVTIGIRPEYVHIVDHPGDNTFLCSADRIVDGVSLINCFFNTKNADAATHWIEVSLHKSHAPLLQEGHECYLYLPPKHIAIISD